MDSKRRSAGIFRTKSIEESIAETQESEYSLKKRLTAVDLTVFGVGVIIGAGIFTLTGRAAATVAGPAILISFIVAAVCCGLAALCYAEFASTVPVSGSAYTFSYATLGEFVAWIIGWDLLLELMLGASVVAQGWSAYVGIFLEHLGITIPESIAYGSSFDLPALLLVVVLTTLVAIGIKESMRVNLVLVAVKLFVVLFVIVAGIGFINTANYTPFIPPAQPAADTGGSVWTAPLVQTLFGMTPTHEWFARLNYDPATDMSQEEKTWPSRPPKPAFHDSFGYYPGLFFSSETGSVYFNDYDASVVLPAKGPYSTLITDPEGNVLTDLFGATVAGFPLGTGNPGDDHVHFGLHAEVIDGNDLQATVRLWNKAYQVTLLSMTEGVIPSGDPLTTTFTIAENIGGKIEQPVIIVALPEGVTYVEGSGFGGLGPLDDAMRSNLQLDAGAYLVWMGDDIWTGGRVEPFGFEWTAEEGTASATFEVMLFRQGNILFQTEAFTANEYPYGVFLPIANR